MKIQTMQMASDMTLDLNSTSNPMPVKARTLSLDELDAVGGGIAIALIGLAVGSVALGIQVGKVIYPPK